MTLSTKTLGLSLLAAAITLAACNREARRADDGAATAEAATPAQPATPATPAAPPP